MAAIYIKTSIKVSNLFVNSVFVGFSQGTATLVECSSLTKAHISNSYSEQFLMTFQYMVNVCKEV